MIVHRARRTVGRRVAGQVVLVRLPELDTRVLNEVGGRVWELAEGRTVAEIAAMIAAEFDTPAETVRDDVDGFVRELEGAGFLRVER